MSGFDFGQIGKTCEPSEPGFSSDRCGDAHSVMSQPVPVEEGPVSGYVYYLIFIISNRLFKKYRRVKLIVSKYDLIVLF